MKLLFICTGNLERSPTAEKLFKDRFETRSAGIVCGSSTTFSAISPRFKKLDRLFGLGPQLGKQVTAEMLEWADVIAVMEPRHHDYLTIKFPEICRKKRLVCLDIPDRFFRDDPELIRILETKVAAMLKETPETSSKEATLAGSTTKRKVLFICTENLQRSPTAEKLFKDRFETRSVGFFSKSNPVTDELLEWADAVVVMEKWHHKMLVNMFPEICKGKRIFCLDIPDRYYRDDPRLVKLLEQNMKDIFLKKPQPSADARIHVSNPREMKVLFICGQNLMRSPTAEEVFRKEFKETRSAGLYNAKPVTAEELEWADVIAVMEEEHRIELVKMFPDVCLRKRLLTLGIPDIYRWRQPELVRLLERKMKEQFPEADTRQAQGGREAAENAREEKTT